MSKIPSDGILESLYKLRLRESDLELYDGLPDGQGDGPKACVKQAAADSRGSRTCVCANTFATEVAHAGEEG